MGDDWRQYPFELVPGDPQFVLPGRRGQSSGPGVGHLVHRRRTDRRISDRKFAFLTIFNKNRPGPGDRRRLLYARAVRPRQRHLRHLHRLRHAGHEQEPDRAPNCPSPTTTWTSPTKVARVPPSGGPVATSRTELVPYTYDVSLFGTDQQAARCDWTCTSHRHGRRCRWAPPPTTGRSNASGKPTRTPTSRPA